jgi:hypothetical protein
VYFFNRTITASLNAFAASSETLLLNGNGRRRFLRTCGSNTTVNLLTKLVYHITHVMRQPQNLGLVASVGERERAPEGPSRGTFEMSFNKVLLLASAAGLTSAVGVPGTRAADLPARQAAPIEYVRICDAYGAGFFFIPGTDSCLKVGGMVLTELRGFDPSFSISGTNFYANGTPHPGVGFVPSVGQYSNARSRDAFSFAALGRVELDTRTQSPWGGYC